MSTIKKVRLYIDNDSSVEETEKALEDLFDDEIKYVKTKEVEGFPGGKKVEEEIVEEN